MAKCFSCCFRASPTSDDSPHPSFIRSSSLWIRSKAQEIPEIRDKCRTIISQMGRRHHRKGQSADFRYDPLSYALNFDEGDADGAESEEEIRHRNFSARLPASPAVGVACG